jgi:gliding motility-associated-like protein
MAITVKGNGVGANGVGSASYTDLPLLTFSNSGSGPQEQRVVSSVPFPLNVWTHLAVTIEGNVGKMYLNGVLVGVNKNLTLTLAAIRPTTANYIGQSQYPADPYLNAKLDEMRFWTVARSQTDIIKGMKVRYQQDYPNLAGYYPFDEGSGTKFYDKSVNKAEGTITRSNGSPWEFPSTSPSGSFTTYNWSTGSTTSGTSITPTSTYFTGSFTVSVVDVRGCTADVPTDVAIGVPIPTLTLDGPGTFCYGIGVNVTSSDTQGVSWFKNGVAAPTLTGQTIQVLDSGTYTAKTTIDGCTSDPSADVVIKIDLGCDQDGDGVNDGNELKDGTGYLDECDLDPSHQTVVPSLAWEGSDCDGDGVSNSQEVTDQTGLFDFCSFNFSSRTLTPSVAWSNSDCDKDGNTNSTDPNLNTPTAVDDNVGILEADYAKFNVLSNDDFLAGSSVTIQRTGGTAKGTEVINQQTGEITYRSAPGEVGTVTLIYTVCNTAVTPEVCAEATVTIDITIAELKIPQGFSPNGNSKNDKWVINGLEAYPENSLKVFNRWGNEVYSAAPYKYSWDGTSISGGRVPAGTYYFVLDLGNGQRKTGYVFVAY